MSTLSDLNHVWGGDLSVAANGDLLLAGGSAQTEQRILRRLMTSPATATQPPDYTFQPKYGAGLPSYVGSAGQESQMAAVTKGQVLMESAVAKSPPPVVDALMSGGALIETITYTDATTGQTGVLSFNVTPESQ